jgi:SAM-dependent methyltransferase
MSFDDTFACVQRSDWLRNRFGSLVDEELPAEVEPFSFVPLAGMREVAAALDLHAGDMLVDLGCGRGGPGMWLARDTGAVLTGVDGSAVALAQAADRAGLFGLEARSRFVVGDLAGTGLPDASADGVVCIDAFMFATDVVACAREVHRLLRPGRRFVLTTWLPTQPGDPALPDRYRNLDVAHVLASVGFTAVDVRHRPAWEAGHHAVYEAALNAGDPGADEGLAMIQQTAPDLLTWIDRLIRIMAVAQRPLSTL